MTQESAFTAEQLMQYHRQLMPYVWTVLSDISVCMAYYKYRTDTSILHIAGILMACFITIITTLPTLVQSGYPQKGNPLRMHYILSTFLYLVLLLQISLGIVTILLRSSSKNNTRALIKIRKGHRYLGYSILIIAKLVSFQDFINWSKIIWNTGFFLFLMLRYYYFTYLQQFPQPIYKKDQIKIIESYSQIRNSYSNCLMYGNYIYDCQKLQNSHPGGFGVIVAAGERCIQRYMFGMHNIQLQGHLFNHSHSQNSLLLLGNPLAKLQISQQFVNFTGDQHKASIQSVYLISSANNIYQVNLKIQQTQNIRFSGCTNIKQLGRYYSLTINRSLTRLYTTVNFLVQTNLTYLQNIFPDLQFRVMVSHTKNIQQETNSFEQIEIQPQDSNQLTIPILVKLYQKGIFTNLLIHQNKIQSLVLSCSKGRGLQLDEIESGKVIIVAGGSGIFPFCDLIDLLFKQEQLKIDNIHNSAILINNPILRNRPLDQWQFSFLLAFDRLSEIHPIIWRQLVYLTSVQKIQTILKIKDNTSLPDGIVKIEQPFQQYLDNLIISPNYIRKILICGPPKLQKNVAEYLTKHAISNYQII